ncbi:hypothetical protein [Lacibacter sediminis]|uniref:Uncharacterized protein n=1 Tax=Lacibacter sediminis TaxID=2760713 RepID=A0A7G5XKY4_9BACT|nr:hypothetical protein [Lacibacter sediminis]QNA46137.1 hypothetical protein H4075_08140 [Lacibacter sediminis]
MIKNILLTIAVVCITCSLYAQAEPGKEYFFKPLKWKIIIPEGTKAVSNEEWNKLEEKGAAAIEKTYGEKIENNATTLFVVKYDDLNYFEANQQPYDSISDPDYPAYFHSVNVVLYETFKEQIPNGTIDTSSSEELIAGLLFQKFRISIGLPNNMVIRLFMYSRPFGDKEFTINIMYVDEEKGIRMMSAWKKSTFGR